MMEINQDHTANLQQSSALGDNIDASFVRHSMENEPSASSLIQPTHQSKSLDNKILPADPVKSTIGSDQVRSQHNAPSDEAGKIQRKSGPRCRFYGTKKGCRAGNKCPYSHVDRPESGVKSTSIPIPSSSSENHHKQKSSLQDSSGIPREEESISNLNPQNVSRSRQIAHKPTPQHANKRDFEINQIVRRYSPNCKESENNTTLLFKLKPSDPDFPFELEWLDCTLIVPKDYPENGRPSVRVNNVDMPRGYQINVERGFDDLVAQFSNRSLLSLLNEFDKQLEKLLTSEKAQTIKIVPNAGRKPAPGNQAIHSLVTTVKPQPDVVSHITSVPSYTHQQREDAKAKRELDIRHLEARMSQVPLFSRSNSGLSFNIPLHLAKAAKLPTSLQAAKEFTLNVPLLFNLEPCTITMKGVGGDEVQNVEMAFEKHAREHPSLTLTAHINHLTQNLHQMASLPSRAAVASHIPQPETPKSPQVGIIQHNREEKVKGKEIDEDRPHVRIIPRPPEWDMPQNDSDGEATSSESTVSDDGFFQSDEDEDHQSGGAPIPDTVISTSNVEKGILISLPNLELYGIELLQVSSLSLTLKCDRCKESLDIKNIKSSPGDGTTSLRRTESCNKCASYLSVTYRSELLHANSIKAGYLDLEGCSTVLDMLPSTFIPTCSECSTPATSAQSGNNIISVRGDTTFTTCRNCHQKLTFKIPEIKFLRLAPNASANFALPPRRKKETLGITVGTELPNRGKCAHYRKSYRWFRFSCCMKVYPCDRCHDEQVEGQSHKSEFANRMICGWCSREQNYRPEDCGVCGGDLVGKKGTGGFWEGGKGTRDKVKMRRKDPRKYKRR